MFDINAIINNAIATAVAEAIKPLDARIEALEMKLAELTPAAITADLDQQEWFWIKLNGYITRNAEAHADNPATGLDYHDITQRVVSLLADPMFSGQMRSLVGTLADTGMEERM